MKEYLSAFFTLLKIIFCLLFTAFAGYFVSIITISVIVRPEYIDWQILLYIVINLLLMIGLWLISFIKTKLYIKIFYFILFTLYFYSYFFFGISLPSVRYQFDQNYCVEDGICGEGTYTYKDGQRIIINKENCLKYKWQWNEDSKSCDIWDKD